MFNDLNSVKKLCLVLTLILFAINKQSLATEELPQIVSSEMIADCKFISTIEGSSDGGEHNWQNLAKQAALEQAQKLTASHVVWESVISITVTSGMVTGKAYLCQL